MAKILFGVQGEGYGHAIRSKVLIKELKKSHDIKIVAGGKAYQLLRKFFNVNQIGYFKFVYRNNKVSYFLTFLNNLLRFPIILASYRIISGINKDFKPDVILTDFEPLVDYYGYFKKIPVISIDNQHILTNTETEDIPKKYFLDVFLAKLVIRLFIIKANKNFIITFFYPKPKDKSSILTNPIIREEIRKSRPIIKDHILIYQTSQSDKKLLKELLKINSKFIVYGLKNNKKIKNVVFKKIDEKAFIEDLRTCKAVITNGGLGVITEALYLKKPILSIPVKQQFEQILNAIYVERGGYGMYASKTDFETINKFISSLPKIRSNLKKIKPFSSVKIIKKINKAIKELI